MLAADVLMSRLLVSINLAVGCGLALGQDEYNPLYGPPPPAATRRAALSGTTGHQPTSKAKVAIKLINNEQSGYFYCLNHTIIRQNDYSRVREREELFAVGLTE